MVRRHPLATVVLGLLAVAFAAVAAAASTLDTGDGPAERTASRYAGLERQRLVRADVRAEAVPASVLASGFVPRPAPQVSEAPVSRLRIGAIGVDAPVIALGVDAANQMEAPEAPEVVAWYPFTGQPGKVANTILSGHLDYVGVGPAVFWELRRLAAGDLVEVTLEDGTVLAYEVATSRSYPADAVPMEELLAKPTSESLTLMTCGGQFAAGAYSDRLVVRAVRK